MNPLPARLWGKLLEPKTQVEPSRQPFSNQDLKQLIVPLFVEQLLAMLVGIADTLMVSYAGEAAVSGVSLVNMLNTFFIFLFTALASGGAVVVSQYIGSKDGANSNLAAGQLYTLSFLFSLVCMAATLVWNRPLLGLLFGQVEPDVMEANAIYLRISAYSYPFLALVQRRGGPVPLHEQDKGHHADFAGDERHQRGGQRHWHFRPPRGGGWGGLALYPFPGLCRRGHDGTVLLPKRTRCACCGKTCSPGTAAWSAGCCALPCPTPLRTACSSWPRWR